jgi:hypothetical protein
VQFKEAEKRHFDRLEAPLCRRGRIDFDAREGFGQLAGQKGVDDGGEDIALPANGPGVAELRGDLVDRGDETLLGFALRVAGIGGAKRFQRQQRPSPGPEILRGEMLAGDLAQVIIDVAGGYRS